MHSKRDFVRCSAERGRARARAHIQWQRWHATSAVPSMGSYGAESHENGHIQDYGAHKQANKIGKLMECTGERIRQIIKFA